MNASDKPALQPPPSTSLGSQPMVDDSISRGQLSGETGHSKHRPALNSAAHTRSEVLEMTTALVAALDGLRDGISGSVLQSLVQRSYKLVRYVIALNELETREGHATAALLAEASAAILIDLAPGPELGNGFDKAIANYREMLQILNAKVKI